MNCAIPEKMIFFFFYFENCVRCQDLYEDLWGTLEDNCLLLSLWKYLLLDLDRSVSGEEEVLAQVMMQVSIAVDSKLYKFMLTGMLGHDGMSWTTVRLNSR